MENLSNLYKKDWARAREKWLSYWKRENKGRPIMHLVGKVSEADAAKRAELKSRDMEDKYQNAERMVARYRMKCETHEFLAESFPNLTLDFGPGSMATYLGCEPGFAPDTVWFHEFVKDWIGYKDLVFDPENKWFKKHIELYREAKKFAGNDMFLALPDIMENLDVMVSMRGAQDTIYDLVDEPEELERRIKQIDDIYFNYYDAFYKYAELDGGTSHTVFEIWGEGRTAKLQCDFSAMISPANFREFIQPSLRKQAQKLDNVLYHLDGPDAIRHVEALMEIDEIDSLQWTSGDHGPDGTLEEWYPIYDAATKAGKALWIKVYSGGYDDWVKGVDKLVARYGTQGMYLYFPTMPIEQAKRLLDYAERNWK